MPTPVLVKGLSELAPRYPALICDVWGVVHNGRRAFEPACAALARYRQDGGAVVLLSNSPRPRASFTEQMRELGVPDTAWDAVATSGDATRELLKTRAPGPVLAVGPPRDAPFYEGLQLEFVEDPGAAAVISCTGLYDDEADTPEDYRPLFQRALAGGLEMVCANPDRVVQRGRQMIPCAGALADVYEAMGGKVLMAGKPHAPIYELACRELTATLGRTPAASEILAVGDGIPTDVLGANGQGFDLLFIVAGIHARELRDGSGGLDPARIERLLALAGAHARYATGELRW
ncbi:MAG TPA: TIGR01459 family HAD-type hydrolase [Caulobacteraceae bacterium]